VANQNIGIAKGDKSDKCIGVSQLWGARAWAAPRPKSTPMRRSILTTSVAQFNLNGSDIIQSNNSGHYNPIHDLL